MKRLERPKVDGRDHGPTKPGSRSLQNLTKRWLDVSVVVLTSPIALVIAVAVSLAVKLEDGGPIFYSQRRLGLGGRVFRCWKFRSMVVGADRQGLGLALTRGDSRVTRVGRFIRRWGLDELPQLWNVIRGDMSIVGPRPALERDLEFYDDLARQRLEVRPGLAGWAWIHGRRGITWEERYELDAWYVSNLSLRLDFYILLMTVVVLFRAEGLHPSHEVLAESAQRDNGDDE